VPSISIFTYGTLMIPEIMSGLIGRSLIGQSATLSGYRRSVIINETYPGIAPHSKGVVPGILYHALEHHEIEILNHYEGHLYTLSVVNIKLSDDTILDAYSYVLRKEYWHLLTEHDWDLETFKRQSQATFLKEYKGLNP